jgi:hypothetical protein
MRGLVLTVVITVVVCTCFYYGAVTYAPHDKNPLAQQAAVCFGFLSALAWGLSVAGALIGTRLAVLSGVLRNGWFNFFAASLAAVAVGFTFN